MQSLIHDLYSALLVPRYRYPDTYSQMRARVTLLVAVFTALACLAVLIGLATVAERTPVVSSILGGILAVLVILIVIIGLVHAGQLRLAIALTFTLMLAFSMVMTAVVGVEVESVLLLVLPLIYTSLMQNWVPVVMVLVAELVLVIAISILEMRGLIAPRGLMSGTATLENAASRAIIATMLLAIIGTLAAIFSFEFQRLLRYAARLITQLRATAEIAQIAATATGPDDLLVRTVNYIRDRFGFYHVQIFLLDADRRYANLVAGTGEIGEMLIERGYRLAIGSQSVIGRALQTGEPMLVTSDEPGLDTGMGRRPSELLRETRSELVLPLVIGDQVIGALDVQSTRATTFTQEIIDNLRILATQVGVAINQNRQLDDLKVTLNDTRRMFLETEINLRETQRLNQRLTGQAWEEYLKARGDQIIGYTLLDNRLQRDAEWPESLEQAARNRRAVIGPAANGNLVLAVPIELRGRAIGAIEVEMDGAVRQAETLDVLQSVAQRLALSIDNARLFEQAQELAQRELEVNTISANLQGINDIETLARATVQELSRALGAAQASIRLGVVSAEPTGGHDAQQAAMPERQSNA
jgi:GAF domain-containing protein